MKLILFAAFLAAQVPCARQFPEGVRLVARGGKYTVEKNVLEFKKGDGFLPAFMGRSRGTVYSDSCTAKAEVFSYIDSIAAK